MPHEVGVIHLNTPMFADPGFRVARQSRVEEPVILRAVLDEILARAAARGHAVAVSIAGEMDDESLIGILRAVSDGSDTMRHVIPEHRYEFTGPALVCARIGCVVESEAHASRLLASIDWCCFTTFPRFVTLPVEHAIDTLVQIDFDSALREHGGIDLDLCRDYDVVTIRTGDGTADEIAASLIDRWDPVPRRGVAWVIDAQAFPERTPDSRHLA